MANSVDPDQTAPLGAVQSGSKLFAQTCLSENLGPLRYSAIETTYSLEILGYYTILGANNQDADQIERVYRLISICSLHMTSTGFLTVRLIFDNV